MKKYFLLIILIASVLRILYLGQIPKGLSFKEATLGWRAQNLISSGKDEYGREFPFIFSNWQDLEMPLPTYISAPFVMFDQTNVFLLRLPFALAGILSVVGAVLLVNRIYPNNLKLAYLTGFVMAVNPWGIVLSRTVSPEILAFCFLVWGIYFFLDNKKSFIGILLLIFSLLSSKLAFFIVFPLLLYLCLFRKTLKINWSQILPIFLVSLFLVFLLIRTPGGKQSFFDNDFSLFKQTTIIDNINLQRGELGNFGPAFINGILFNKSYFLIKVLENLMSALRPSYFFSFDNGSPSSSYNSFSPLLLVFLPFFIFGLVRYLKDRRFSLLNTWLALSFIPIIFIAEKPTIDRLVFALLPLSFLIALGLDQINSKKWKIVIIFLVVINLSILTYSFSANKDNDGQKIWQPETSQVINFIKENSTGRIWITDISDPNPGPTIAYLLKKPFSSANLNKQFIYKGWVSSLDNISIGGKDKIKDQAFDLVFVSVKEKDEFSCLGQMETISHGKSSYLVMRDCIKQ